MVPGGLTHRFDFARLADRWFVNRTCVLYPNLYTVIPAASQTFGGDACDAISLRVDVYRSGRSIAAIDERDSD
jgi:hypothetical protein